MGNQIYTIGREFGSAGYEVGRLLAERLGVKLYDKELLAQAAKDSGFCEEIFENHDDCYFSFSFDCGCKDTIF